jgi:hypothetical protein
MNIRRGMARVARATAIAYWIAATAIAGAGGYTTYSSVALTNSYDAFASVVSTHPGWRTFDIKLPDGRTAVVDATDEATARAGALEWAGEHPRRSPLPAALLAAAQILGIAVAVYLVLWALFRTLRWIARGFMDAPVAE